MFMTARSVEKSSNLFSRDLLALAGSKGSTAIPFFCS